MQPDKNLHFIASKILDTKVAIFHCFSNSVCKLPNMVINTNKVDDDGNIWFFIKRPLQQLTGFEHEFACLLDFYKKGNQFSMSISGKAIMFEDEKDVSLFLDITPQEAKEVLASQILFKVKMIKVSFFDLSPTSEVTIWTRLKHYILNLLNGAGSSARTFDFS